MKAFLYGVSLQWKLDIRSKTLLITCYLVPNFIFYHYEQLSLRLSCRNFKVDFDSIYDRIWRDHGRADRFTTVSR